MANSGSYARGDQPRSVPDPLGLAYDAMIAKQKALNARQAAAQRPGTAPAAARPQQDYWGSHPGFAESMIPVWGSAREAIADYQDGDMVGAAANGVLAVTDLTGEGFVLKELGKGGLKVAGSHTWNATRKWLGKKGALAAGEHGHHWLIPNRANVPGWIKNQPWNIKGIPSPEVHGRIHGSYGELPQFNPMQRYVEGTPTSWKVQNGLWAEHGAVGAEEALNPAAGDDRRQGR